MSMPENNNDKKNLVANFFSLSALQGVNMILPLVTLPYLVRVLGVENFGLLNFSLSIIMYFNILISFGFELSATREVSVNRDNKEKVSEIFSSILAIKLFFVLVSLIILSILIATIDRLNENADLYYVTFGLVIGNSLFSSWFFQGMEKMKYITYINVASKIFFTLFIFILVKEAEDIIVVAALTSLGAIVSGVYSLRLVVKLFKLKIIIPDKSIILHQIKGSYHFFLSGVASKGYRFYIITIVGVYFDNIIVGYYVMAEKLLYAFLSIGSVVSQTLYPYMSRTKNLVFFKKVFILILIVSIIIIISVMAFNKPLLKFVFEVESTILSNIFLLIFSGAIFGVIGALIGYPLLAALGHSREANNSLIIASALGIIYTTVITVFFNSIYLLSFAAVVFPVTLMLLRVYFVYKTDILKSKYPTSK